MVAHEGQLDFRGNEKGRAAKRYKLIGRGLVASDKAGKRNTGGRNPLLRGSFGSTAADVEEFVV
jgi:hypothetical protein